MWDFGTPEITDLQMDLVIHSDPPDDPANHISTIYCQLYDFRMFADRREFVGKGIYSYHGLQSNVFDANEQTWRGSGLLFSRYQSSDRGDVRLGSGGWPEFPTPQHARDEGGEFVGVRNKFDWGKGTYRSHVLPVDEDSAGIWYQFKTTNTDKGDSVVCGFLRFPTIDGRRPLIPNGGTSWIEVTPHTYQLSDFPSWHVTFRNVVANGGKNRARSAAVRYADDQAPARNSDISQRGISGDVDFWVGNGVIRRTPDRALFRLA